MDAVRFPGESAQYRAARDALTRVETDLTRRIEDVAALRRSLPPGGLVPADYAFTAGPADLSTGDLGTGGPERTVRLSELFGGQDTLLLYSMMYSPEMDRPCPMCTSVVDSLDGAASDVVQRAGFAVVASSPIGRIRAFARERGWTHVPLVSSAGTTYNRDYHGENSGGEQFSRMNVFTKAGGQLRHYYATEQSTAAAGQDDRHVDLVWPLWNLLDLTPTGRGQDWRPSYSPR
jgi:predicted dithiol-disulfide oxidoreductase (DUF899 family)